MKKALSLTLTLALVTCLVACVIIPVSALEANPTTSTVLVNGKNVAFDAYNINDNNYFKLRDLAYTLSGTEKQFEVSWDGEANAISLTCGQPYTAVGGEMTGKGAGVKTPTPTTSKIIKDGKEVSFTAYNIDGNNYFKLRDIGAAFDFGVDWDEAKNTIVIDTSKGYTPGETPGQNDRILNDEEKKLVGKWGSKWNGSKAYGFYDDGTCVIYCAFFAPINSGLDMQAQGFFSLKDGVLTLALQWSTASNTEGSVWGPWGEWETSEFSIEFGIDDGKECWDRLYDNPDYFNEGTDRFIRDRIGISLP